MSDTLARLTCSQEYSLVARRGRRCVGRDLVIQAYRRPDTPSDIGVTRFGLTASRKVGGAVQRNRARRRMRAAAITILPKQSGCDLVLIARRGTVSCGFAELLSQIEQGLCQLGLSTLERRS